MPKHSEVKILPYTPQQLFDLVADVGKYPEFLPWCVGARIREKTDTLVLADLVVGFKLFREQFTSKVTLDAQSHVIEVEYLDGPFRYLNNRWQFLDHPEGCKIDFFVDFEFKSLILQKTIGVFFGEAVVRMISAFESRAQELYGIPDGIDQSSVTN
ncbi:MAG: type II toxin-antitoxin system RatA family toxin [Proteobacteria bacterium]|nr:type II toxin-antitoxin system RatA family toxin [Pseudomonadota bacterium]